MGNLRGTPEKGSDPRHGRSGDAEPTPDDAANYLVEVLPELSALAERSGLEVVAYFLEMARAEVEESANGRKRQRKAT